jgi:hypothetical protein
MDTRVHGWAKAVIPALLVVCAVLFVVPLAHASIVYTQDSNLSDFTTGVTFGTFISAPSGFTDIPIPSTPTPSSVNAGGRAVGNGNAGPIVVDFGVPVSTLRIFPNIDHLGASFDGYQYTILGSNDNVTYSAFSTLQE